MLLLAEFEFGRERSDGAMPALPRLFAPHAEDIRAAGQCISIVRESREAAGSRKYKTEDIVHAKRNLLSTEFVFDGASSSDGRVPFGSPTVAHSSLAASASAVLPRHLALSQRISMWISQR